MSSVARVCLRNNEGLQSISVFMDGTPDYLGKQLLEMDSKRVKELISVGNIRALENGQVEHPYNENCLEHNSIDDLINDDTQAYYFYILDESQWYFKTRNTKMLILRDWLNSNLNNLADI